MHMCVYVCVYVCMCVYVCAYGFLLFFPDMLSESTRQLDFNSYIMLISIR